MSSCQLCKHVKGDRYTSLAGSSQCDKCIANFFKDDDDACRDCLGVVEGATKRSPGVDCSQAGTTLAQLPMLPGHFRFAASSESAYVCTFPENCVGGNGTGAQLCKQGSRGPLW